MLRTVEVIADAQPCVVGSWSIVAVGLGTQMCWLLTPDLSDVQSGL